MIDVVDRRQERPTIPAPDHVREAASGDPRASLARPDTSAPPAGRRQDPRGYGPVLTEDQLVAGYRNTPIDEVDE